VATFQSKTVNQLLIPPNFQTTPGEFVEAVMTDPKTVGTRCEILKRERTSRIAPGPSANPTLADQEHIGLSDRSAGIFDDGSGQVSELLARGQEPHFRDHWRAAAAAARYLQRH
jgi:hypothetical protein